MKKYYLLSALLIVVVGAISGCNMPISPTSTPGISPLQLSVTALFATAEARPTTVTPHPAIATVTPSVIPPTAENADTPVPPTAAATAVPPTAVPPTKTRVPPTATVPSARQILSVNASFMKTAPTIDGDWSEWKDVGTEYPANYVVFGKDNWKNEDDLSSSYYVGWDGKNLYIAVKVHDDRYVQNSTGENIFKGDSIELLIDTNVAGDYYVDALNTDDYQIGISPGRPTIGDGNREAYRWYPIKQKGALSNVTIGAQDEGAIYRVEAAIPWSDLGVTPQRGMHLGFCISVSDNDSPGNQVQQSMVSNVSTRHLTDPTTWGDLILK
jgi:hypothetical protein